MRVEIELFGDKQVSREILRIGERAGDPRPVFDSIADLLISEEQAQFSSQGRHASGGWRPLKASTLAAKARRGLDPHILHATHALRNSLTRRGDSNQILEVTRDQLRFGTKVAYARFHQLGTSTMPRRRPLELTETARREVVRRIQRYLIVGATA